MELFLTATADIDNLVVGDLHLDAGQLILVEDDSLDVAQEIRNLIQFFKGEWFLDTREGVPYFESILVKNPKPELIRSIFRQVILKCRRIQSVPVLDLVIDGSTRRAAISFVAKRVDGTVLKSTDFPPFIVDF